MLFLLCIWMRHYPGILMDKRIDKWTSLANNDSQNKTESSTYTLNFLKRLYSKITYQCPFPPCSYLSGVKTGLKHLWFLKKNITIGRKKCIENKLKHFYWLSLQIIESYYIFRLFAPQCMQ